MSATRHVAIPLWALDDNMVVALAEMMNSVALTMATESLGDHRKTIREGRDEANTALLELRDEMARRDLPWKLDPAGTFSQ